MSQQAAVAIAKKRKRKETQITQDRDQVTHTTSESSDEFQEDGSDESTEDSESQALDSDDLDEQPINKRLRSSPDIDMTQKSASTARTLSVPSTKDKSARQPVTSTISKDTLNFLRCLQNPDKNDREWFQAHKGVYNEALENWRACVQEIISQISDRVPTIPYLPSRDLIYRIYRDVRFSANKTPYKDNMSFSVTRTGRKGPLAGIYCHIRPGDNSLICIGKWDPDRTELERIRAQITENAEPFREVLRQPEFVALFGSDHFDEKSETWKKNPRQSVWGCDDMLKRNPKGVAPNAENIDLLRLKSIVVRHMFKDSEVMSPAWPEQVAKVAAVGAPLLELLNDWMGYAANEA